MCINEYKLVDIKDLSIGDSFRGIHYPSGKSRWGPTYTVENISDTSIKCIDDWYHETTSFAKDQNIKVEIPLTTQEYKSKYFHTAKEVVKGLQHDLYTPGDAYHEMWNGWIDIDPYGMAQSAIKYKLTILSYFTLSNAIDTRDIGIVVEDENCERFWCHANSEWFKYWKEDFPELYE